MFSVRRLRAGYPSFILLASLLLVSATLTAEAQKSPTPSAPPVTPLVSVPANTSLAAKAPGTPGYGLQVTSSTGKYIFSNLCFHPSTNKPTAQMYRIVGPAGMGPYRIGAAIGVHPARPNDENPWEHASYFYVDKADDGSPAKKAGLDNKLWISTVDGSNFGWNLNALIWHITNSPVIVVDGVRMVASFTPHKVLHITTTKIETPVDPGDGNLEYPRADEADTVLQTWVRDGQTWKDLLILRSKTDRFAPFAFELAGRKLWVVRVQLDPTVQKEGSQPTYALEFWKEDPLTGPIRTGILEVWQIPEDGHQSGRVLRIEDRWYLLKNSELNRDSGRLISFEIEPWKADIDSLLSGANLAMELGPQTTSAHEESLEQWSNDALVEWKTRTLPVLLKTEDAPALEDQVIRIEKGMLSLDLQIRGMRQRLDDLARAKAAQQAQANMPGGNQTAPAPAAGTADSQALADLLDQRKAILQAVLGSTKQALAQVRR
jgi:hypothetical protein